MSSLSCSHCVSNSAEARLDFSVPTSQLEATHKSPTGPASHPACLPQQEWSPARSAEWLPIRHHLLAGQEAESRQGPAGSKQLESN